MDARMRSDQSGLCGGLITAVGPHSLAARLGVQVGDLLLHVNGEPVEDVIDVQYYAADYEVALTLQRDDEVVTLKGQRREGQPLGLAFANPTFDVDIRRCNNLCEFCFVLQMAPQMRRTLYIKDDDYRYSFLFGYYVTLTNLTKRDEKRIVEQHLSPLFVSVHATDLALRRACLRNPKAPDVMKQLARLTGEGIEIHTQIVVTPGLNDGPHLEKSVRDLARLYPGVQSVSIVPVGLTRHHKYDKRTNSRPEAEAVLDACTAWRSELRRQWGVNFVYPTDEWYLVTDRPIPKLADYDDLDLTANGLGMVRRFLDDWQSARVVPTGQPRVASLTLVTAALFAPTLARCAAELSERTGVATTVVPISNTRLGETITVSGLLMGEDIIAQLSRSSLADVIVLPRITFDHPDTISLDDRSPLDVARALGRPVALADTMSDVIEIIGGRSSLLQDPME
jgi:putative radical SAM enzyme (TIGR03279 family)